MSYLDFRIKQVSNHRHSTQCLTVNFVKWRIRALVLNPSFFYKVAKPNSITRYLLKNSGELQSPLLFLKQWSSAVLSASLLKSGLKAAAQHNEIAVSATVR